MPGRMEKIALAVLASGRGSNFEAVQDAIERGELPAEIRVLICDKEGAPVLEKARRRGIETRLVMREHFPDREAFEKEMVNICRKHRVDAVVLAGFMRVLGPTFVNAFPLRILNIHPSLLPAFPGLNAQRQALEYGVKISGCTVHFVDNGVDSGPIILQQAVPVLDGDDEDCLADRILEYEHRLLPRAIRLMVEGRLQVVGRKVVILPEEVGESEEKGSD